MRKKAKTRWEMGCFDSFESPFLIELHRIRKQQAEETKGLSPKRLAKYIKSQAEKIRETKSK